jgi:hypothetical protein
VLTLSPQFVPKNLFAGLLAGIIVAAAALLTSPHETQAFYQAAVQVVPVFLVALALERSLAETLGTESSVIVEQLQRVDREWTPPSSETRTYYGVGLQLRELDPQSFRWDDVAAVRADMAGLSDVDAARTLPRGERLTRDELRHLTLALAARALGDRPRIAYRTRKVSRDELLHEWDVLSGALTDRGKERAKAELRYEVAPAYEERRRRQRRSILVSVATLAVAELLAFIGLLSPGRPYTCLFATTAGAVAASFVAVTIDAITNLLARQIDVQSAGLDWTDEPPVTSRSVV